MKTSYHHLLAVLFWTASVHADVLLIDPGTSLTGTPNGATYTVGYDFTVGNEPLLVTELGIWDQGQDGFSNQHIVGLWDTDGDLLTSLIIPAGTSATLDGQFRYESLTSPVLLSADSDFIIGASYVSGDADRFLVARTFENANPILNSAVAPGGERFGANPSTVTFPSYSGGAPNLGDFGPNMVFDVVPEPSVFCLSAVCVVCWTVLSRKTKQMHMPPNTTLQPKPAAC